jgi:hypothetical protein
MKKHGRFFCEIAKNADKSLRYNYLLDYLAAGDRPVDVRVVWHVKNIKTWSLHEHR